MTDNDRWLNKTVRTEPSAGSLASYWKSTVTEFLQRSDPPDINLRLPRSYKGRSTQPRTSLTKEETLTEARRLIRKDKSQHSSHQRKEKVVDREIYQYKMNLENGRLLRRLQMDNGDELPLLERKHSQLRESTFSQSIGIAQKHGNAISRCLSLSDISTCQKDGPSNANMGCVILPKKEVIVDLKKETCFNQTQRGKQQMSTYPVTCQIERDIELAQASYDSKMKKNVRLERDNYSGYLRTNSPSEEVELLPTTTLNIEVETPAELNKKETEETPIELKESKSNLETCSNDENVAATHQIGKKKSKISARRALRIQKSIELSIKSYYWTQWKRYTLLTKAKQFEERKWQEKINNFMTRLDNHSKTEAQRLETDNIVNESSKKVQLKTIPLAMVQPPQEEDVQLTEFFKAIEQSTADTREQLRARSVQSMDPRLRGKARLIRVMTQVLNSDRSSQEGKLKPFPQPKILMETVEKQMLRQQRLKEIQEKKRLIEQERDQIAREKYELQLMEEARVKKRKLLEFREKMRRQRIEQEMRKQEWLRIKILTARATQLYHTKLLTRYGFTPWLRLVELRWEQCARAEVQNERRIKREYFLCWRESVDYLQERKEMKAQLFWRRKILVFCIAAWRAACRDSRIDMQVAEDWCDFFTVRRTFERWLDFVYLEQRGLREKWAIAVTYHKRKEATRHIKQWMLLPQVMYLEREKEQRKRVLREKVQQILPDFRPASDLGIE